LMLEWVSLSVQAYIFSHLVWKDGVGWIFSCPGSFSAWDSVQRILEFFSLAPLFLPLLFFPCSAKLHYGRDDGAIFFYQQL